MKNLTTPNGVLAELAGRINAEHQQAETALRSGLEHARRAGELLIEAKGQCPHGRWLPWLEANVTFSPRTAQAYMRVADRWEELQAKAQGLAHLTFEDGLKLLAAPQEADPVEAPTTPGGMSSLPVAQLPLERRRDLASQWWDILATYTVFFDARGWEPARTAELFGVPPREVELILTPEPPVRFDTHLNGAGLVKAPQEQRQLQRYYADDIARLHHRWLSSAYRSAAYHAAGREACPELEPGLKALSRQHDRQWDRLRDRTLFNSPWADTWLVQPLWCCSLTDARAAVGIEPVQDDGALLTMLGRFRAIGQAEQGWN